MEVVVCFLRVLSKELLVVLEGGTVRAFTYVEVADSLFLLLVSVQSGEEEAPAEVLAIRLDLATRIL